MPWGHMGERKEETRKRGTWIPVEFMGDVGGEGEIEAVRHKPAQDWMILRYHVLRITVPILACVRVYLTLCTCTETAITYRSWYFLFSLFFSLFLSFPRSFVSLHSRPSFSHSSCPPSSHHSPSRGRPTRLLFAARTRVSLSRAHTPEADRLQFVAYLNTDTRYTLWSVYCIRWPVLKMGKPIVK